MAVGEPILSSGEDQTDRTDPPPAPSTSGKLAINLDDVELSEVVRMFTKLTDANIVATPEDLEGRVTVHLKDVEWEPALESILAQKGLTLDDGRIVKDKQHGRKFGPTSDPAPDPQLESLSCCVSRIPILRDGRRGTTASCQVDRSERVVLLDRHQA